MIDLSGDPGNPVGVATPSWVTTRVIDGQRLDLYSGVAEPEFAAGGDVVRDEVIVRLPGPIADGFQATAAVNLASISNGGSDFLFATDEAWVELDQQTGDLLLHVPVGVGGSNSYVHRFGYHVNVLSTPVQAAIEGSIEWAVNLGDPADPLPTFELDVYGPVPGGLGPGPEIARGFSDPAVRGVDIGGNPVWSASFTVGGPLPLNTDLTVVPTLIGGFNPSAYEGRVPVFNPSQRTVQCSYLQPIALAGFELTFEIAPPRPPPPR
jgi:hypothetical protein